MHYKVKIVNTINMKQFLLLGILMIGTLVNGYTQSTTQAKKSEAVKIQKKKAIKYKVTFIELGSIRCIPCQQMQPVMKSINEKYINQVNVVFHDVWTPEGKPFATQYNIQAIPTQVFLDETGKEFFRHEGYFSEEELVKVLKTKGVK
jgi:thioredoxin 1